MEAHPFGSNTSSIVAQKITHKGLLGEHIWLLGTVVRVRQKLPDGESAKAKGLPGGKNTPKGKSGKKGKGGAKDTPTQNYEIHLNGGSTPADVILVVAWDEAPRKKLEDLGKIGAAIAIHKAYIKEHDANTLKWTTSRHSFYAHLGRDSDVRLYTGALDWLTYHPLSKLPSLHYVPSERLVCIAGRVLSPGPRTEDVMPEGSSETVAKTSFHVRAEDRIVLVEALRDTAGHAQEVHEGGFLHYRRYRTKRGKARECSQVTSAIPKEYKALRMRRPFATDASGRNA